MEHAGRRYAARLASVQGPRSCDRLVREQSRRATARPGCRGVALLVAGECRGAARAARGGDGVGCDLVRLLLQRCGLRRTGVDLITEDTDRRPVNPYEATKLVGEQMIEEVAATSSLRAVSLRYLNVAGAAGPVLAGVCPTSYPWCSANSGSTGHRGSSGATTTPPTHVRARFRARRGHRLGPRRGLPRSSVRGASRPTSAADRASPSGRWCRSSGR